METVIFIESNTSGTGEIFINRAISYNYKPVFLSARLDLYPFLKKLEKVEVVELDTLDENKIIDFCKKHIEQGNNIKGITSSSEYYIEMAAKIANYFELPGANALAISNCRDKFKQCETLLKSGLKVPLTKVIESMKDIDAQLADINFPIIVKPIQGTGSVGVKLCNNLAECKVCISQLLLCKENERGMEIDNRVLIEEYIQGDEFSGEVFNGKLVGFTKKHLSKLPYFVETGHDFPAEFKMTDHVLFENEVHKAIVALGLGWGACHVEFRIFNGQLYFIEVNPRLAGGFIPEIVKKAIGIDLVDNQLRIALGLPLLLEKNMGKHIGIRFIIPFSEGYITDFAKKINEEGILDVKEYKPVGTFFEINGDFRDRVGHVIFDEDILSQNKVVNMINDLVIVEEKSNEKYWKN